MTATAFTCEAPTDAQLRYIAGLCDERGLPTPPVYSKRHASILIDEIRARTYDPDAERPWPASWPEYAPSWSLPFGLDCDASDVPF